MYSWTAASSRAWPWISATDRTWKHPSGVNFCTKKEPHASQTASRPKKLAVAKTPCRVDSKLPSPNHGWPSTQPNRITHNLAAHGRGAHNPAARWCGGSVVCNLSRQQCRLPQRWTDVGTIVPTLGQRWGNLHCCLTGWVVEKVTHTGNYGSLLVTWYKKYFSARNIFFRKKYFSPQEIYFSPQ